MTHIQLSSLDWLAIRPLLANAIIEQACECAETAKAGADVAATIDLIEQAHAVYLRIDASLGTDQASMPCR